MDHSAATGKQRRQTAAPELPTGRLHTSVALRAVEPRTTWWHWLLAPALGTILIVGWEALARSGLYADFIIPAPTTVAARWWAIASDGSLLRHAAVTLREVLTGLLIGVAAAFWLGYGIARSRLVAYTLTPYLVALQAVPIVAVAPLLIIWFGAGIASKVIICALLVFFPMLVNTVLGVRNISPDLRDLMRSLEATPLQTAVNEAKAELDRIDTLIVSQGLGEEERLQHRRIVRVARRQLGQRLGARLRRLREILVVGLARRSPPRWPRLAHLALVHRGGGQRGRPGDGDEARHG